MQNYRGPKEYIPRSTCSTVCKGTKKIVDGTRDEDGTKKNSKASSRCGPP